MGNPGRLLGGGGSELGLCDVCRQEKGEENSWQKEEV